MLIDSYCECRGEVLSLKIDPEQYRNYNIITRNPFMLEQLKRIRKISNSTASVVIYGETGTGKELYAEFIHHNSNRRNEAYAKINCATLPENLFESEMFGYMPGSFTGALKSGKKGLFEITEKGTLFLDEVAELPLSQQSKLLRVLQEKKFVKVGGNAEIKTDARIIAASNIDLKKMSAEGGFRRDLYYRLNVIPVRLLPLRERKEDVILLTFAFLNEFNQNYGAEKKISVKLMEAFLDHSWPGNVRELKNTLERMVLLADGDLLKDTGLLQEGSGEFEAFEELSQPPAFVGISSLLANMDSSKTKSLKEITEEFERNLIREYVKRCGSLRKAAAVLHTSPSVLSRKLNKEEK